MQASDSCLFLFLFTLGCWLFCFSPERPILSQETPPLTITEIKADAESRYEYNGFSQPEYFIIRADGIYVIPETGPCKKVFDPNEADIALLPGQEKPDPVMMGHHCLGGRYFEVCAKHFRSFRGFVYYDGLSWRYIKPDFHHIKVGKLTASQTIHGEEEIIFTVGDIPMALMPRDKEIRYSNKLLYVDVVNP